jgi:hypothetical protein
VGQLRRPRCLVELTSLKVSWVHWRPIGFVHEFRPIDAMEMQALLDRHWTPVGVSLPNSSFTPEVVARLIRITSGDFRLLARLVTQVERVLGVNDLHAVTLEVVEAARDSLIIGQA